MVMEAIDIRCVVSGRWKIVVAMKFAKSNVISVRVVPVRISKVRPAEIMIRVSSSLFSALRLAVYWLWLH
jgi:hypothetical protein